MENKGIAVRVAAGDEPLQSVAGDHTLPPAVCLVGLIVLQRCVGAAVTDLLQVAKQVFYHRCVRLSGTGDQRGQQPCRQQQAQAFFQYSFHFFVSPSRENARPLLLQNRLKRLSSSLYHKHIPIRNKKRPAAARRFLHIAFHPNQSRRYNCRQTECFGSVRRPRNCLGTPSTGRPAPKWARTDHRQYFLSSFHPAFPCCTRRPTERYR